MTSAEKNEPDCVGKGSSWKNLKNRKMRKKRKKKKKRKMKKKSCWWSWCHRPPC
jgi:hypothetical protein